MLNSTNHIKSPRNKTITLSENEIEFYKKLLIKINSNVQLTDIENKTINQDTLEVLNYLPNNFVDLIFIDPPYNLNKKFNTILFKEMKIDEYEKWVDSWVSKIVRLLKPTTSIYICCDWKSSNAIYNVVGNYFKIQNRITFQRNKGRGAEKNWKNCSEDIWFCTMTDDYYFDVESVKIRHKVIAPYIDKNGKAKDWKEDKNGKYRMSYPSNVWTNISMPFWSMSENTEHPTQKPEEILKKIILASSKANDVVFDPFLGVGTTSVVAKKLGRRYVGIELDEKYSCISEKRLQMVKY